MRRAVREWLHRLFLGGALIGCGHIRSAPERPDGSPAAAHFPFDSAVGATPADAGPDASVVEGDESFARLSGDAPAVAASLNAFALDVYGQAHRPDASWVFSPASLANVLSLVAWGSRGPTLTQLARLLHARTAKDASGPGVIREGGFLRLALRRSGWPGDPELFVADRLWAQRGIADVDSAMKWGLFNAAIGEVNRMDATDAARGEINRWAADQSGGHFREVIRSGWLDADVRVIATSAAYLAVTFESQISSDGRAAFYTDKNLHVAMEEVSLYDTFPYAHADGVQLVELPAGHRTSFLLAVPDRIDGLRAVETQFTKGLDRWLAMLSPKRVVVRLPHWTTRSGAEFRSVLHRLGVHLVLSGPADLPLFTTKPNVRLDRVFHEAVIDVRGTRVPGAIDETDASVPDETAQEIRADHPFLYLVRDLLTGIVLVIGRFAGPE